MIIMKIRRVRMRWCWEVGGGWWVRVMLLHEIKKILFAVCSLLPYRQCFFVCQRINILKLIFQGGVCWLHSVQRQYQPVLCRQTHFWISRFQRIDNVIIHTKIDATFTFQRRKNVIILTTISSLSFFFKSGFHILFVHCHMPTREFESFKRIFKKERHMKKRKETYKEKKRHM